MIMCSIKMAYNLINNKTILLFNKDNNINRSHKMLIISIPLKNKATISIIIRISKIIRISIKMRIIINIRISI